MVVFYELTTIDSRLAKRTQTVAGEKLADQARHDAEETPTKSREISALAAGAGGATRGPKLH